MSSTVIYKQSYKARAAPSTPGLNVRHLQYIATRPGAIYNPGCGFGLWGQLPGDDCIRIQTDLERAKQVIRDASGGHTLYRAIISVGKQDAQDYGLYQRDRWEHLVNDHIPDIAKEMDIKPENLYWCASMHSAKNHPHVHILYWDNSEQPRPEFLRQDIFEQKAERIRAAFAGEIHREDIREIQKEQREQLSTLRTAMQTLCREANPQKALDIPRLYRCGQLNDVADYLADLLRRLPAKGSLRYKYLPKDYKELVDQLIDRCLQVPELAKELDRYEQYTREISQLYSNGDAGSAKNIEKAITNLRTELGNEVMDAIRELRAQLQADTPRDISQVRSYIQDTVSAVLPTLETYPQLLQQRSGTGKPLPDYYDTLNAATKELLSDARIRLQLEKIALEIAGIDLDGKPNAPRRNLDASCETVPPDNPPHTYQGKRIADDEWEAYRSAYQQLRKILRETIQQELVGDLRTSLLGDSAISAKQKAFISQTVSEVAPSLDSFRRLRSLLPAERIPLKCMEYQIPGYHDALNKVIGDILWDGRIRLQLQTYALEAAGMDLESLPDAAIKTDSEDKPEHVLYGKILSDEQWDSYQNAYREAKREIRRSVTDLVREDAGWTEEALRTGSTMLLCGMMRLLSQSSHQRQAGLAQARSNLRIRSKDKSREAKMDYRATQAYASEWEDNYS